MAPGSVELVALSLLATLLIGAVVWDLNRRQIPNLLVTSGALSALGVAMWPGGIGWMSSLLGGAVCFGIFLLMHLFRMVGAGDVKLMGAVGMFQGLPGSLSLCLSILLVGGLIALFWYLWCHRKSSSLSPSDKAVPYALSIAVGTGLEWFQPWWFYPG